MQSTGPTASCDPNPKAHILPEPFKTEIVTPLHQHYRQTDRVPGQSVSSTILCEKSLLLSKISWNTFYIIVSSLDKRAQLDLSLCGCPICGTYLPALKIALPVGGRSFPDLLQKCEMDEINCCVSLAGFLIEVLLSLCGEHNVSCQHPYS